MALDVGYTLNGMPLDTDYCHVKVGSTMLAGITSTRTVTTIPGRHGSVPTGMVPRFGERQLTVRILAHDGQSDAMARRFIRLCTMPALTMTRSVQSMYGGDESLPDQSTRLELSSLQPDGDERPFKTRRNLTAVFAMPDVFWRAQPIVRGVESSGRLLPGALAVPTDTNHPQGLATIWLGGEDASSSMLFDRLPDGWMGDAPITDPIIRIASPSHVTVTDPVSGTDITWSGTSNGQYLYVDPLHLHAWLAAADNAWSGGTDSSSGLDWSTQPLEIWTAADNTYKLAVNTDGQNPTVQYSPTWW